MELLVHASTSGHLLVACSLEVVPMVANLGDVRVIMVTLYRHLLLWATTIFVRVHIQRMHGEGIASIHMLCSGRVGFVMVVAHVASSTTHHGSPRT